MDVRGTCRLSLGLEEVVTHRLVTLRQCFSILKDQYIHLESSVFGKSQAVINSFIPIPRPIQCCLLSVYNIQIIAGVATTSQVVIGKVRGQSAAYD